MPSLRVLSFILSALLLTGTVRAQEIPACRPPDTLALRAWARNGQGQDSSLAQEQSGTIAARNQPTGAQRSHLLKLAEGAYAADVLTWQRRSPIPHWTTIYFSLHTPSRNEVEVARLRYRLTQAPDLIGYLWGSRWFAKDTLYPAQPRAILAVATDSKTITFRIEGLPGCDDCGSFELALLGPAALRGWWSSDGAVTPEPFSWFCALRL